MTVAAESLRLMATKPLSLIRNKSVVESVPAAIIEYAKNDLGDNRAVLLGLQRDL
jgi:hypothetical protein